ncbi:hypothetical protein Pmani_028633 [Petrolisthes manimaculis]|uniref:histone acetyltransferase n=1 Tax=Petrolisthes manimaculis TaxID=1843537 RepID=A0AAE1P199_9EUCA|nr:hypothetical protein Pmani_028633 [Petrolisthes manimaculis]
MSEGVRSNDTSTNGRTLDETDSKSSNQLEQIPRTLALTPVSQVLPTYRLPRYQLRPPVLQVLQPPMMHSTSPRHSVPRMTNPRAARPLSLPRTPKTYPPAARSQAVLPRLLIPQATRPPSSPLQLKTPSLWTPAPYQLDYSSITHKFSPSLQSSTSGGTHRVVSNEAASSQSQIGTRSLSEREATISLAENVKTNSAAKEQPRTTEVNGSPATSNNKLLASVASSDKCTGENGTLSLEIQMGSATSNPQSQAPSKKQQKAPAQKVNTDRSDIEASTKQHLTVNTPANKPKTGPRLVPVYKKGSVRNSKKKVRQKQQESQQAAAKPQEPEQKKKINKKDKRSYAQRRKGASSSISLKSIKERAALMSQTQRTENLDTDTGEGLCVASGLVEVPKADDTPVPGEEIVMELNFCVVLPRWVQWWDCLKVEGVECDLPLSLEDFLAPFMVSENLQTAKEISPEEMTRFTTVVVEDIYKANVYCTESEGEIDVTGIEETDVDEEVNESSEVDANGENEANDSTCNKVDRPTGGENVINVESSDETNGENVSVESDVDGGQGTEEAVNVEGKEDPGETDVNRVERNDWAVNGEGICETVNYVDSIEGMANEEGNDETNVKNGGSSEGMTDADCEKSIDKTNAVTNEDSKRTSCEDKTETDTKQLSSYSCVLKMESQNSSVVKPSIPQSPDFDMLKWSQLENIVDEPISKDEMLEILSKIAEELNESILESGNELLKAEGNSTGETNVLIGMMTGGGVDGVGEDSDKRDNIHTTNSFIARSEEEGKAVEGDEERREQSDDGRRIQEVDDEVEGDEEGREVQGDDGAKVVEGGEGKVQNIGGREVQGDNKGMKVQGDKKGKVQDDKREIRVQGDKKEVEVQSDKKGRKVQGENQRMKLQCDKKEIKVQIDKKEIKLRSDKKGRKVYEEKTRRVDDETRRVKDDEGRKLKGDKKGMGGQDDKKRSGVNDDEEERRVKDKKETRKVQDEKETRKIDVDEGRRVHSDKEGKKVKGGEGRRVKGDEKGRIQGGDIGRKVQGDEEESEQDGGEWMVQSKRKRRIHRNREGKVQDDKNGRRVDDDDDEGRRLKDEEARRVKDEEARRVKDEEARRVKDEEARRVKDEEARRVKDEEARRVKDEEARRVKDEEARRVKDEEARRVKDEEARRVKDEEARRVKDEEARRVKDEEARRVKDEEARRVKDEETRRVKDDKTRVNKEETKRIKDDDERRVQGDERRKVEDGKRRVQGDERRKVEDGKRRVQGGDGEVQGGDGEVQGGDGGEVQGGGGGDEVQGSGGEVQGSGGEVQGGDEEEIKITDDSVDSGSSMASVGEEDNNDETMRSLERMVASICDEDEGEATEKNENPRKEGEVNSTENDEEMMTSYCLRVLLHARRCKRNMCKVECCQSMKGVCSHIETCRNVRGKCQHPLCHLAKTTLGHYEKCHEPDTCTLCGPVKVAKICKISPRKGKRHGTRYSLAEFFNLDSSFVRGSTSNKPYPSKQDSINNLKTDKNIQSTRVSECAPSLKKSPLQKETFPRTSSTHSSIHSPLSPGATALSPPSDGRMRPSSVLDVMIDNLLSGDNNSSRWVAEESALSPPSALDHSVVRDESVFRRLFQDDSNTRTTINLAYLPKITGLRAEAVPFNPQSVANLRLIRPEATSTPFSAGARPKEVNVRPLPVAVPSHSRQETVTSIPYQSASPIRLESETSRFSSPLGPCTFNRHSPSYGRPVLVSPDSPIVSPILGSEEEMDKDVGNEVQEDIQAISRTPDTSVMSLGSQFPNSPSYDVGHSLRPAPHNEREMIFSYITQMMKPANTRNMRGIANIPGNRPARLSLPHVTNFNQAGTGVRITNAGTNQTNAVHNINIRPRRLPHSDTQSSLYTNVAPQIVTEAPYSLRPTLPVVPTCNCLSLYSVPRAQYSQSTNLATPISWTQARMSESQYAQRMSILPSSSTGGTKHHVVREDSPQQPIIPGNGRPGAGSVVAPNIPLTVSRHPDFHFLNPRPPPPPPSLSLPQEPQPPTHHSPQGRPDQGASRNSQHDRSPTSPQYRDRRTFQKKQKPY